MSQGISSLLAVLKRQSLPAISTFAAVIAGSIIYLAVAPSLYFMSASIILEDKRVSVSELGRDLTQVSPARLDGSSPLADQAELIKSQRVLEKAISSTFPEGQKELTVGKLKKLLKVKIVPATNILELTYQDQDPALGAKLLNAITEAMIEENVKAIRSEATKIREFLENEVPKAEKLLLAAKAAESKYRKASNIVSFEEQSKSIVESLANLEQQERTLLGQLGEVQSRLVSLEKITRPPTQAYANVRQAYANVRSGQDEELKNLRTKLADLEQQIAKARLQFTRQHPKVIKLVGEYNSIQNVYNRELARVSPGNQPIPKTDIASDPLSQELTSQLISNQMENFALGNKLKIVQYQRANLQAKLAQLPIQQKPLTEFTRKREEAEESLKSLKRKLEEARIAEAQKVSNLKIIEEAKQPESPASPNAKIILLVASILGIVLSTSVVLLLESMDTTLKDASEVEELLKSSLLGVLPRLYTTNLQGQEAEGFLDDVNSIEPYRMLIKNIESGGSDRKQSRIVVIASTVSKEGKSVVASHLGAVSAMLSRRTLIIDADFYQPEQHKIFGLEPRSGIVEVIEKGLSWESVVKPTCINNLSVLTCGERHRRPSHLVESNAMKSLLAEVTQSYDLVIIDTTSMNTCADAVTLSSYGSEMILVTRPGFTLREVLQKGISELKHNNTKLLGVVANNLKNHNQTYVRYPLSDNQSTLSQPLISST